MKNIKYGVIIFVEVVVKMRITRIIVILLIGLLVIAGGCSSPAPVPTEPAMPTMPNMPVPPVPTLPPPTPTPPTPAPAPTTPPAPPTPAPAPPTPTPPPAVQGPYDIWIPGNTFNPITLTVPVGTNVTWTNKDGNPHTVTSNNGLFDSFLAFGQSFIYTFTERGSFSYYCKPHDEMSGKVIVE